MAWVRNESAGCMRADPTARRRCYRRFAGSVATVAGVAFSIVIAALSQASSQFGPRLLRNFMHVSVSLQAPAVVAFAAADLDRVIARLDTQQGSAISPANELHSSGNGTQQGLPPEFARDVRAVIATKGGYVLAVDYDELIKFADVADVVLQLGYRPGGDPAVWPRKRVLIRLLEVIGRAPSR